MLANYLLEVWKILSELAPWLFLGAGIAGLLKVLLPDGFISHHLGGSRLSSILKTTLLGIPLPLCSCGVLPTTLGLKKSGASNGASVGFLISTPQTGVDSILVTASFLGWPLALFKVVAALVTGMLGGIFVHATEPKDRSAAPAPVTSVEPDSHPKHGWRFFYDYAITELLGGIYIYLGIGILVAALITVLFPSDILSDVPILKGPLGMLIMLAFAIPIYVCTTGSVPIAASLIAAGLPIGSALVFLMAGPATNAATLAAVLRSFGKKITAIYLGTVILGSMAFGLLFQSWLGGGVVTEFLGHHEQLPWWVWLLNTLSAVALMLLVARWSWQDLRSWWRRRFPGQAGSVREEMTVPVSGMTCESCSARVRNALENLPNVQTADIDLKDGVAHVHGRDLNKSRLHAAVRDAGYTIPPEHGADQ